MLKCYRIQTKKRGTKNGFLHDFCDWNVRVWSLLVRFTKLQTKLELLCELKFLALDKHERIVFVFVTATARTKRFSKLHSHSVF